MSRRFQVVVLAGFLLAQGCSGAGSGSQEGEGEAEAQDSEVWEGDVEAAALLLRPKEGTPDDWRILREKAIWAWELGLDTLSMGESMVYLGLSFLDSRYTPGTLELPGSEELVVNLQELDCVTFVENVLALAQFIRSAKPRIAESEFETKTLYRQILTRIRYRGGRIDGYPSRLHYFSDWILDNESKGFVREVTEQLEGIEDARAVDFMSEHPESYRQLANPLNLRAIQEQEFYLSGLIRHRIPEEEIPLRVPLILDGDIIAATSTVDGLDVAHTGIAVWLEDRLHLLHAPLVGEVVEVSALPLAERILRLESQDGIRVIRPLAPEEMNGPEGGAH
jgi:hypothetical protein